MKTKIIRIFLIIFPILIIGLAIQIVRPFRAPKATISVNENPVMPGSLNIHWPAYAQGAVCIANEGVIDKTQDQSPKPTASVAKLMTAYIILKDHPLPVFQDGPDIVFTSEDERVYENDKKDGQSVIKVVAGEKLTERQMLEALLLPSANNVATKIAEWDSGSVSAFVDKMNKTAQELGMKNTHYEDPSGINLNTQSSAYDQLVLAQKAMEIETLKEIVALPQATLPVAGVVYNVDYVLGKGGIVGIKTGSMPKVGGNFVFASYDDLGTKQVLIIGALLGVDGKKPIMDALYDSIDILKEVKSVVHTAPIVKKDDIIGTVKFRPNHILSLKCAQSLESLVWPQREFHLRIKLKNMVLPIREGDVVGKLTIEGKNMQTADIVAAESISKPTLLERLTRLYY